MPPPTNLANLSEDDLRCQPIGEYCVVIGRMSANKGRKSRKRNVKAGQAKHVQVDLAANLKRRRQEGRMIRNRIGQNAPVPYTFKASGRRLIRC